MENDNLVINGTEDIINNSLFVSNNKTVENMINKSINKKKKSIKEMNKDLKNIILE